LIYLDSSVALAHLLGEGPAPRQTLWREPLLSSELIEYEIWNRLLARDAAPGVRSAATGLIGRLRLIELSRPVLTRALEPFPVPVRTLDALHLATAAFVGAQGQKIELASYDRRMLAAADALRIPIAAI
jgi:predicted nucleic acid-binding protein